MRSLYTFGLFAVAALVSAPASAEEWGSIKGQLVMENGNLPAVKPLTITKEQEHCLSRGPILPENYVVNPKNKGVQSVVVWIAADQGGRSNHKADLPLHPSVAKIPADRKDVVMDQPCCKFEPHVVALRKGQDFVGKNTAPVAHNMLIQGNNGVNMNPALIANVGEVRVPAAKWKPHYLPTSISCAIHPWMQAKLFVFAHPYFAITDENGNFEIKNVPAGKLRLIMWHDGMGWVVREKDEDKKGSDGIAITVPDGKTLDLGKVPVK